MDKIAEKLAEYSTSLSYTDLSQEAVHAAKRSVVDSIGCAIAAFTAEPSKTIRSLASQISATKPATVIGTRTKTSPELAALANGFMIRYLDFSDDYIGGTGMGAGPHPSDNIGGILAAAESNNATGKDLVLGIVLAYEACGQLVDLTALRPLGWDYPVLHSIATVLGAGRIMGLSRGQMSNALSLSIVPNICLRQTRVGELSHWKGFAGPNGSRNGLFAALLAKEGITGPGEPFEGKAGFMAQLKSPFEMGALGGKGTPFKIEETYFKYLPVAYAHQLPVWVAFDLRQRVRLEEIVLLKVYVGKQAMLSDGYSPERWKPSTRETADHSAPYLIGAALVDGEITEATFNPERFHDPAIMNLLARLSAEEDQAYTAAYPKSFECRLEATLRNGKVVAAHLSNPKGHPANPMSDCELEDKFYKQVGQHLSSSQSRSLVNRLRELETFSDLGELFDLMLATE